MRASPHDLGHWVRGDQALGVSYEDGAPANTGVSSGVEMIFAITKTKALLPAACGGLAGVSPAGVLN